jgi:AcrR family transcriptional regulator
LSNDKKTAIKEKARELFHNHGFKDTNVSAITKEAHIATGTFYLYYPSKDKLFMDIFLEENARLKKSIMEAVNLDDEPMKVMQEMMYLNFKGMSENPILREWYNRDVFNKIEQNYREENGLDKVDFLYDAFLKVVRKWQVDGKIRNDIDTEMIMAIFSALVNIDQHKEEIGLKYFPKIMEYIAEFIMKGLKDVP